jgi:uncharacterized protein involved in exopolysaccharide biosynthesis
MADTVDLSEIALILFRNRKPIGLTTLAAMVIALAVVLVAPKWYKGRATVLPPESTMDQMDITGLMMFAGYQPAMLPGLVSPTDIYAAVLESNRVKDEIIEAFNLIEVFKAKDRDRARKKLEKRTTINLTGLGLVELEYEDRDKQRAADIANAYVEALDRYNREARVTTARKVREFIETRIDETRLELDEAEVDLQEFKERTGAVLISEQTRVSIETAAEIYARIAELEVSIERLGQFATERSPEIIDLRSQIRALERKLAEMGYSTGAEGDVGESNLFPKFSRAPEMEKELATLLREVEIKRAVYGVLSEQYEQSRIQEMRDTPTVQVLDWAKPPIRHFKPKASRVVPISGALAFFLSSFYAVWRQRRRAANSHPESTDAGLWEMLSEDYRAIVTGLKRGTGKTADR